MRPGVILTTKASYRILVADDEASIRTLLNRILTEAGHQVTACEDGEEAHRILKSQQYSLLILDFHMPHRTGLEIIRELRHKSNNTPVILMSGALLPADLKALDDLQRVTCYEKVALMADGKKAIEDLARTFQIERPAEPERGVPAEPSEESDHIPGDPEAPR